jgi:hypothetical protein
MPKYRVMKKQTLTEVNAEQVVPITPAPSFRTQTVHVRVVQGGFMDDKHQWHEAPRRIKDAVRINGVWYWACHIRNPHSGDMILRRKMLFATPGA